MGIKRVKAPFAYWVKGTPRTYTVGQLVDDTDPGIKGREQFFEDVETHVTARVEQATAEPGEKRTVTRPPRPARRAKGKDEQGEGS